MTLLGLIVQVLTLFFSIIAWKSDGVQRARTGCSVFFRELGLGRRPEAYLNSLPYTAHVHRHGAPVERIQRCCAGLRGIVK